MIVVHLSRTTLVLLLCCCAFTPNATAQAGASLELGLDGANVPRRGLSKDEVPDGVSAGDWAGIQEAYEAGRHAAQATAVGYETRNPGQRWLTQFDGRGFLTEPDAGGWAWGLELTSYGFLGSEQVVTRPSHSSADGGRVFYEWGAALTEWYENDKRGLEHGYTVHERPVRCGDGEPGPLIFTLAVRGGLRPDVMASGRDVRFLDEAGTSALTYSGLSVFDVDGTELVAGFESEGACLQLRIDERDAQYPLTIDPIAQQAYLKASNTDAGDLFGFSVALSCDTIVVGAPLEDSNATGVNGNQGENSAINAGAAYVFVRSGATWTQQAYLKASNTNAHDGFAGSVAVSGDTIVVGAADEASNASGVNGNQGDNSASAAGAAYVFVRSGTTWTQQAYLKASNTEAFDRFGGSVAVHGDTVVVGAQGESSNATGVNGPQGDNSAGNSGAAYVFVRSVAMWSQQAYLKASNTDGFDLFGTSVAVSGDTIVAGAPLENSNATGVNGNQGDNSAFDAGAAYAFLRSGTAWSQQAYLKASNTDGSDFFGTRVAVSGDTIAVGANGESGNATGVNGNQGDNSAIRAGAAYVFVRSGSIWSQQAYLKASNTDAGDQFGSPVALSDDMIVVGARHEASNATGVNGNQGDNNAASAGAAYAFVRSGNTWTQQAYLKASNTDSGDEFGIWVAVSGDTIVVGATHEASNATGVNGSQGDNSAAIAGAAYVFDTLPSPGTPFCFGDGTGTSCPCNNPGGPGQGCANGSGAGAILVASGSTSIAAANLVLHVTQTLPNQPGLFFQGANAVNGGNGLPFGDGLRCAGGSVVRLQVVVPDGSGNSMTSLNVAAVGGVAPGDVRRYQLWYRDPLGSPCGSGFNLSNGLEVVWVL